MRGFLIGCLQIAETDSGYDMVYVASKFGTSDKRLDFVDLTLEELGEQAMDWFRGCSCLTESR